MSTTAPRRDRPRFTLAQGTFETIFGFVYSALAVNVMLVATNLPLALAVLLLPDPLASWPFLLLLSLTLAPSVAGAFAAFRAMREDGPPRPLAEFWRGYRRSAWRALGVGAVAGAIVFVTMSDVTVFAGTIWAPLAGPTLLVLAASSIVIAVVALAGFALYPDVSAKAIVKASIYLAIRRWYFSVMALALIGLVLAAVLVQPVFGAAFAPSVLLFAVWGNAHFSFIRLVDAAL